MQKEGNTHLCPFSCTMLLLLRRTGILLSPAHWGKEFSVQGLSSVTFQSPKAHVSSGSLSGPWSSWGTQSLTFTQDCFRLTHLNCLLCRVLLCKRQECRPTEWITQQLLGAVAHVFPTANSVPVETVARAMVACVLQPGKEKVKVLENGAIHELGKAVPQQGT